MSGIFSHITSTGQIRDKRYCFISGSYLAGRLHGIVSRINRLRGFWIELHRDEAQTLRTESDNEGRICSSKLATAIVRIKARLKNKWHSSGGLLNQGKDNSRAIIISVAFDAIFVSFCIFLYSFHRTSLLAIISAPFWPYLEHPNFRSFIQSFVHHDCIFIHLFVVYEHICYLQTL